MELITKHIKPNIFAFCAIVFFFLGEQTVHAQSPFSKERRAVIHQKIDDKQLEIDFLDGVEDQAVELYNNRDNNLAKTAYFTLIDLIQINIESTDNSDLEKYNDLVGVHNLITNVNSKNVGYIDFYHDNIYNAYGIITHKSLGSLSTFLYKKMLPSLANVILYKDEPIAEQFLTDASGVYPAEVLKAFKLFEKEPYAQGVLEYTARIAPNTIKKYFPSRNLINSYLIASSDTTVKTIIEIYKRYGTESKAYFFLDKIMEDKSKMSYYTFLLPEFDSYLDDLIEIRKKENPYGEYSLDEELKIQALKYVRVINDMHLLKDASNRFSSIDSMSAEELYTLICYSQDEIFTSTYNGSFSRFMNRMQTDSIDGYEFLKSMHFNQFRTFIKLCAGYNTLNEFLTTMTDVNKDLLFKDFIRGLGSNSNSLIEAVNVADTFGSLEDSVLLNQFLTNLLEEHQKHVDSLDVFGEVIYSLLISLIGEKIEISDSIANKIELLDLPPLDRIEATALDNQDSVNIQQHFFFDDDDGIYSFSTFIQNYKNSNWTIIDSTDYVIIQSKKGHLVQIYANKPLSERKGQKAIKDLFERESIVPSIVVHRGHSYYVHLTIKSVAPDTKMVFLGSCGGYNNLTQVIDRSPKVHIISSKQIGTVLVNNPLLYAISESIRKREDVQWADIWTSVGNLINNNAKANEKFQDYIPPHKNLGAIFLQAYYELTS